MAARSVPLSLMFLTVLFPIPDYCSTRDFVGVTTIAEWMQSHPGDYSFASSHQYGSPQEFTWTDNYTVPIDLVLVQETAFVDNNTLDPRLDTLASQLTHTTSYSWDGKPLQDLSLSNLFWLGVYKSSDPSEGPLFKSEYFNVTNSASSSTTTTTSSSSPSTTTSSSPSTTSSTSPSTTSSIPSAHPTTTPTSTTPPASLTPSSAPKPTNNHVALGAGLGVGLGGTALILAAALFYFLGRKRHNKGGKLGRPEVYQLAENDTFSH